ncbi:MAG TPA: SIS domain-containing protein [Gemmatimonadota bacterium]|nr:SIS domain-containing protein [Gemmatimonadota bacterium]
MTSGSERSGAAESPVTRALAEAAASLGEVTKALAAHAGPALERVAAGCSEALEGGHKVLFAGNGGSAAQCQHLATELTCRFTDDRVAYAALALTTDTSFLTACANDYAFDEVFARQVEALGLRGDALLLFSTSGRSENVLRAARAARARGIATFAFTGRSGGPLAEACDAAVAVPSDDSARIQEAHLLLGHLLCGAIESRLGGFGRRDPTEDPREP